MAKNCGQSCITRNQNTFKLNFLAGCDATSPFQPASRVKLPIQSRTKARYWSPNVKTVSSRRAKHYQWNTETAPPGGLNRHLGHQQTVWSDQTIRVPVLDVILAKAVFTHPKVALEVKFPHIVIFCTTILPHDYCLEWLLVWLCLKTTSNDTILFPWDDPYFSVHVKKYSPMMFFSWWV